MRLQPANPIAVALTLAVAFAPVAGRAADVIITGCPQAGVEAGCIVLNAGGTLYNVTAAKPAPKIGAPTRVTGTISNGVSLCQQGVILSPATSEPADGIACPATPPR